MYDVKPEQSNPLGDVPPYTYFEPKYAFAFSTTADPVVATAEDEFVFVAFETVEVSADSDEVSLLTASSCLIPELLEVTVSSCFVSDKRVDAIYPSYSPTLTFVHPASSEITITSVFRVRFVKIPEDELGSFLKFIVVLPARCHSFTVLLRAGYSYIV